VHSYTEAIASSNCLSAMDCACEIDCFGRCDCCDAAAAAEAALVLDADEKRLLKNANILNIEYRIRIINNIDNVNEK
jgi:hypothetical protein